MALYSQNERENIKESKYEFKDKEKYDEDEILEQYFNEEQQRKIKTIEKAREKVNKYRTRWELQE